MEKAKAKELVITAGKEISHSGLIARTWGNVSCRTDSNHFVITASGRNYMTLTPDEVIEVDLETAGYEGDIKPSSERRLHREIYRLKPDVGFVIHTHQSNASAISAMGEDRIRFDREYEGIGWHVLVADYGLPGSKKLCANTAKAATLARGNAVIMKNHGAICFGRDYDEAFNIAMTLEEACGNYLEEMGVPAWKQGESHYDGELWNDDPAIMKFIETGKVLRPYLDDFAQLVGPGLAVTGYDEKKIEKAISAGKPMLVRGKGALCAAVRDNDREAISLVTEKNCRAALASIGVKPLNTIEARLMRAVYLKKYSKLSE